MPFLTKTKSFAQCYYIASSKAAQHNSHCWDVIASAVDLSGDDFLMDIFTVYRHINIAQFTTPERKMCFPVGRPRT